MAAIEAIATTYLEADAASVTFSSLGSYEHLQLRFHAKSDRTSAANDDVELNLNGDTGSNYAYHRATAQDTTADSDGDDSDSFIKVSSIQADATLSGAANYGGVIVDILDYRHASKNATILGISGLVATPLGRNRTAFFSGLWDNTAAVTSIVLTPSGGSNFMRGSVFSLYGLKDS